jgi:hypothetical protein
VVTTARGRFVLSEGLGSVQQQHAKRLIPAGLRGIGKQFKPG